MPQPHSLSPSPLSKAEGSCFCLSSRPGLNARQLSVLGTGRCTQPRGAQADGPAVPVRAWAMGQHRAGGRAACPSACCPTGGHHGAELQDPSPLGRVREEPCKGRLFVFCFFLSKFLLNACFAITSVRNQHERKAALSRWRQQQPSTKALCTGGQRLLCLQHDNKQRRRW